MGTTNTESGTRIDEIADGIYRISTPVPPTAIPGGFTFNQFLVVDEEPLLFHTGPRKLFPLVREAMASVMAPDRLRWVSFSHWEPDESGSLNEWLEIAPQAMAVQGKVGVNVCVNDQAIRKPRALADGETLSLGRKQVRWIDTPHLPHGWDCGFLFETRTRTLLAGDLFTQGGHDVAPLTEGDILGPSEACRKMMDYYSHTKNPATLMDKLAVCEPMTLACMHGSSWHGDGAKLLRELATSLGS
ncbi:MAG: MBL fold metallo-hydrolase [Polyangiaceae bacterium]